MDFYAVKCLIYIYFVLFPCLWMEECLYKRFKCSKNFHEFFMYLFRWKGGGDALMHVHVREQTHNQPLLQNRLMDVYETW